MNELEQIKLLEEELQDLSNERKVIEKKLENIELEKKVIFNKEEEIRNKISQIKDGGTSHFLGKFAVVTNKWNNSKHYIYITSVATEYSGVFATFSGPNFCIDSDKYNTRTIVCCEHKSAHGSYDVAVNSPEQISIITKEEFVQAFDEFQDSLTRMMCAALHATPHKIKKDEYVYDEEIFEK